MAGVVRLQKLVFSPDGLWLLGTGHMLQQQPAIALWDVASGCTIAVGRVQDIVMDVAWRYTPDSLPEFVSISQVRSALALVQYNQHAGNRKSSVEVVVYPCIGCRAQGSRHSGRFRLLPVWLATI